MLHKAHNPCTTCNQKRTCIHDVRCVHYVLTNREDCIRCESEVPPSPEYREQLKTDIAINDYNEYRRKNNLPPVPINQPKTMYAQRNFVLSEKAYVGILQLAAELGYVKSTGTPSAVQFLESLGQGLLVVHTV